MSEERIFGLEDALNETIKLIESKVADILKVSSLEALELSVKSKDEVDYIIHTWSSRLGEDAAAYMKQVKDYVRESAENSLASPNPKASMCTFLGSIEPEKEAEKNIENYQRETIEGFKMMLENYVKRSDLILRHEGVFEAVDKGTKKEVGIQVRLV